MSSEITLTFDQLSLPSARRVPVYLTALVSAMVGTSSVVMFEPAPTDIVFALLLPVLLVTGHLTIRRDVSGLMYVGLFLFVAASIASLAFCHDLSRGAFYLGVTFYLVLIWLCFVALVGRYGAPLIDVVFKAYTVAAIACSVVGLLARFAIIPNAQLFMMDASETRIRSTFKDPNVFGPFLVAAIILTLASCLRRGRVTLFNWTCLALYFSSLIFAFSRGAMVNLSVALVTFAVLCLMGTVYRRRLVGFSLRLAPLVLLLVGLAIFLLAKADMLDFVSQRAALQSYDQDRFAVHRMVLNSTAEAPLGIGPGQWFVLNDHDIHNLYLRIWLENGLLALVGWLLFLLAWVVTVFRGAISRDRRCLYHVIAAAIVAGILVESLVIDTLHWRHFFLFLALPIGLAVHQRSHNFVANSDPQHEGH